MEKIDFVLTWVDGSDPDWLAGELTPGRADTAIGTISSTGSAVWRNLLPG